MTSDLINNINNTILLNKFKEFCNAYSKTEKKNNLRSMLYNSTNKKETLLAIFANELKQNLSTNEIEKITELVIAFLNKSTFRKKIDNTEKIELIKKQNYRCNFCNKKIDIHAHADHIIPFKYVGDELKNNIQMLCEHCNTKKNASLDYQIRIYINSQ